VNKYPTRLDESDHWDLANGRTGEARYWETIGFKAKLSRDLSRSTTHNPCFSRRIGVLSDTFNSMTKSIARRRN
jgi:hypothetical protein